MLLTDDVLKSIPDEMTLNESSQPWVANLVEGTNNALVELEIDAECLTMSASGKQLKEAINKLPATKQITLLNDNVISFGRRNRRESDRIKLEEHEQNMEDRKLKRNLIKFGSFGFLFLCILFVVAVVFISWKQDVAPDSQLASGLFSTLIEIIKLIFAVT